MTWRWLLDLIKATNGYHTVTLPAGTDTHPDSVLVTYDMGDITYHTTLAEVRSRTAL